MGSNFTKLEKKITVVNYNSNTAGGACGEMVIVIGNEHGDSSSNPGQEWLHFT